MSDEFKFRFDRMRENNPQGQEQPPMQENYNGTRQARNVCFILLDGKRIFLNYAYLVAGKFIPEDNKIILSFTTHIITLTGIQLEKLYDEFMDHKPRTIIATDKRYNVAAETNIPVVNEINVMGNS